MYFIPGVDALRRIADGEINAALLPGRLLYDGQTDIFRHAGINRGFKDHDGSGAEILSHELCGALHRHQIRRLVGIHRGGYSHHDESGFAETCRIAREINGSLS